MNQHHELFLKWLILAVLVTFGIATAFYFNLIQLIILSDISMISVLILVIFAATFIYLGHRTAKVSSELNLAHQVEKLIKQHDIKKLKYTIDDDHVYVCGEELPDCSLTEHIRNLILKSQISKNENFNQRLLLEEYSDSLHDKNAAGWMISQKIVNLGLLGTAIGFSVALSALFGITSFDFAAMKTILSNVSVGMSIALYTTIMALMASIPIEIKSYLIEKGNNKLVSITTKITEVYVMPTLGKNNAAKRIKK